MRRQRPDDRPSYGYQPTQRDDGFQVKRQRPNSKLPPGKLLANYVSQTCVGMGVAWVRTETLILIFLHVLFC